MKNKVKLLASKQDIEAVIKRHGWESVRYVMNKLNVKRSLTRALEQEKKSAQERIAYIERKLKA